MALNISGLSPSFPAPESTSVTNRDSVSQPVQTSETSSQQIRINSPATRFSPEAAILDLSPEAVERNLAKKAEQDNPQAAKNDTENQLSAEEKQVVRKLQARDIHVKMHEQQHMVAGGSCIRGGPSFQYTIGPDGKSYATGGEVQLDVSPVSNNPQATIAKAQTIRRAALAPSDPSGSDRAIAAQATQMETKARLDLMQRSAETTGQLSDASASVKEYHRTHFYLKSYQNISKFWPGGSLIDKIA